MRIFYAFELVAKFYYMYIQHILNVQAQSYENFIYILLQPPTR